MRLFIGDLHFQFSADKTDDATIAPPPKKKQRFSLPNVAWLARQEKGYTNETKVSTCFLVCKSLSIDNVEVVSKDTVFREIRPGANFETGDFVKEMLGAPP